MIKNKKIKYIIKIINNIFSPFLSPKAKFSLLNQIVEYSCKKSKYFFYLFIADNYNNISNNKEYYDK